MDYLDPAFLRRLKSLSSKNSLLARAVGSKKGYSTLLDLTAGWCRDALCFAAMGFKVTAFEREAEVYASVKSALDEAWPGFLEKGLLRGSFSLALQDAREALASGLRADVIYLDPMFEGASSALPKKDLQILRKICAQDDGAVEELLFLALGSAHHRVVVKRARKAPPLSMPPSHSLKGSSTRYDVFLLKH